MIFFFEKIEILSLKGLNLLAFSGKVFIVKLIE